MILNQFRASVSVLEVMGYLPAIIFLAIRKLKNRIRQPITTEFARPWEIQKMEPK